MNSEVIKSDFEIVWGRVKQITGWTKYKQLADFVGTSTESIAGVKKRGKFNLAWARDIAKAFNSYTDYLMDGEGPMKRGATSGHTANGNNIIQGAHIDAEDVHLTVNQVSEDQAPTYADPIDGVFLKDWKSLSDVGKMRVWTLLKEEMEREKEKREG